MVCIMYNQPELMVTGDEMQLHNICLVCCLATYILCMASGYDTICYADSVHERLATK